jgi:hypothetical protein
MLVLVVDRRAVVEGRVAPVGVVPALDELEERLLGSSMVVEGTCSPYPRDTGVI